MYFFTHTKLYKIDKAINSGNYYLTNFNAAAADALGLSFSDHVRIMLEKCKEYDRDIQGTS